MQEMRYSGEPAFQNLEAVRKRKSDADGGNPCMEIILRKNQMCNLTEVNVAGFVEDGKLNYKELYEAQRLSARAGYRMACIDFELHKWDAINKEDMLIGTGLTGWQDMINATNMNIDEEISLMRNLRSITDIAADELADKLGRNRSKLKTTIKPSGSLSQLPVVSPGLHFSHSPYYIRRVRINANDPLVQVVKELGYPMFPNNGQTWENCDTVVIEFPVKAPEGRTKYDVSAIEQLEIYKRFMQNFVQHNASITVHVRPEEWDGVEEWCYENWDDLIAVSFVALDDSFYQLMPYEAITKEEYEERVSKMKPFNPSLLQRYEIEEVELDIGDSECIGGSCPIR
jgi:ribonucleoside-diphosphate reductase alpha chain/ribonucleoside-triphosphate reductase